jgi:hypothetical protein
MELQRYARSHFLYSSPTAFCLAKPVNGQWWIEFAAGSVEELILKLPFWLPIISFNRRGRHRTYATATLVNRFLKNDRLQDGPVDAVPRWGRRAGSRAKDHATCPDNGS